MCIGSLCFVWNSVPNWNGTSVVWYSRNSEIYSVNVFILTERTKRSHIPIVQQVQNVPFNDIYCLEPYCSWTEDKKEISSIDHSWLWRMQVRRGIDQIESKIPGRSNKTPTIAVKEKSKLHAKDENPVTNCNHVQFCVNWSLIGSLACNFTL